MKMLVENNNAVGKIYDVLPGDDVHATEGNNNYDIE